MSLNCVRILVREITTATEDFVRRLDREVRSEIVHDSTQTADVRFPSQPSDLVFLESAGPDLVGKLIQGN